MRFEVKALLYVTGNAIEGSNVLRICMVANCLLNSVLMLTFEGK